MIRDQGCGNFTEYETRHSNENCIKEGLDILIDAAVDILCHLLKKKSQWAHSLIEECWETKIPILQRLAVFGFGKRDDHSSDKKLDCLLQSDLVYRFKTDVFEFLQQSYEGASDKMKQEILDRCLEGPERKELAEVDDRTVQYEIYNLLVWLSRIAPECSLTIHALRQLHGQNPEFRERDRPELDVWSSGVQHFDPIGGLNLDEMEAKGPEAVLAELLACQPTTPFGRSRSSYCSAISGVVTRNPVWGSSWVHELLARRLIDADLWSCVCQGWRDANLAPDQWRLVLVLVEQIEAPPNFLLSFTEVLEHGTRRAQFTLPDDQMESAQRIAERIWIISLQNDPTVGASHNDWLATAINHPGGSQRLRPFSRRTIVV